MLKQSLHYLTNVFIWLGHGERVSQRRATSMYCLIIQFCKWDCLRQSTIINALLCSLSACKRLMFGIWPLTRPSLQPRSFSAFLRLSASGLMKVEAELHFSATEFTQSNLQKAGTRGLVECSTAHFGCIREKPPSFRDPPGTEKVLHIPVLN